ncbi:MAG: rod shape-determining protein [Opitutaceae bacterium]
MSASSTAAVSSPPTSAAAAPKSTTATSAPPAASRKGGNQVILLGFDLGTNKSCVIAGAAGDNDIAIGKIIPSVVGYVKSGIVNGIIPGNVDVLFGEEALKNRLHVNIARPVLHGIVGDERAIRDFMKHVRSVVDPSGQAEIRAVIGVPANATTEARDAVRHSVAGSFERVLLIPEPFLAALGVRDDARLGQSSYVDPVTNSLFIDIGAGTTDLCLVQGYFPTAEDQISFSFAGDSIDHLMLDAINQVYPESGLTQHKVRETKEAHAYVGASRKPIDVKVIIGGKSRTLELGDVIGSACNQLLDQVFESTKRLIARASSDGIEQLLQNIIVTGGGSLVRGLDTELQKRLVEEGFENPKVRLAGQDYQRYVAIGALKAARAARENQWQYVLD